MRIVYPLLFALALAAPPALAADDSFSGPPGDPALAEKDFGTGLPLYERIRAHYEPYGRNVKEKYRDGPCRIVREWERDGDFEEHIKCRGPRD